MAASEGERIARACAAMKNLYGTPVITVRNAVKQLLELNDNKWEFIERDNYNVVFDYTNQKIKDNQEDYKNANLKRRESDSEDEVEIELFEIPWKELNQPSTSKRWAIREKVKRPKNNLQIDEAFDYQSAKARRQIVELFSDSDDEETDQIPPERQRLRKRKEEILQPYPCKRHKKSKSATAKDKEKELADDLAKRLEDLTETELELNPSQSFHESISSDTSLAVIHQDRPEILSEIGSSGVDARVECSHNSETSQFDNIVSSDYGATTRISLPCNSSRKAKLDRRNQNIAVMRHPNYIQDIARGEEKLRIPLLNDNGAMELPKFFYISKNIAHKDAYVNFSLARISDDSCCSQCVGDCVSSELPCACAAETRGEFAYTSGGLLKETFLDEAITMCKRPKRHHFYYCEYCPLENNPLEKYKRKRSCKGHLMRKFIKECWNKCGCNKKLCSNRVVQRGITARLQVFSTPEGKGWGVRCKHALKKGEFVCEYVGEIVTNQELHLRNKGRSIDNEEHTYPVLLDADWGSERVLKDEEALCLDATKYGNIARFINHRCVDANLVEIPVEMETPDHHYYHLAFFATRNIEPMEELNWDYGIQFDDKNHPVKAFKCKCGSKFCRDKENSL